MSFLDKIRKKPLSRYTTIGLTEIGKRKVEEFEVASPNYAIISYLDEHGPSSIEDIGIKTGMDTRRVAKHVDKLVKSNQVKVMRGAED